MVAVAMTVLQLASNPAYAEPSAGSLYKQGTACGGATAV